MCCARTAVLNFMRRKVLNREAVHYTAQGMSIGLENWTPIGGQLWKQFGGSLQGHRQGPWVHSPAMDDTADTAQVIIRPPLAWGLAVIAGLALSWLVPVPF